ncbi:MAG: molybdopterin-dependent oxidoreductase, partial [Anaerolineales bacterium]|nr:molybdopterin-dependent oxidoreductase [Anaerolineales bacterium]
MMVNFRLNGKPTAVDVPAETTLLEALRDRLGVFGVKHGCETGECGACSVLFDGVIVNSCVMLVGQADGHDVTTIEAVGDQPAPGWRQSTGLDPLQQAFVETGAIQCGYCTPAMILAARALLERTLDPSEDEVRQAMAGVLCRCTGYIKPVQAVLRAAAVLRGEPVEPIDGPLLAPFDLFTPPDGEAEPSGAGRGDLATRLQLLPRIQVPPQAAPRSVIGKPEPKVDAVKLAQGKPAFTADIEMRGMLTAKVLHSPHAHARIRRIDVTAARALPGVAAVLTWQDIPRVAYSTAGQSDPLPAPLDTVSLDSKVRFVGDRVAFVAAETEAIAEQALGLIQVDYEVLPALLDPSQAMQPGAPVVHDQPDYVNFAESDPSINRAAEIHIDIGNVDEGFREADQIFEGEYAVPKVQQASIEPHVVVTYWDEDDRLVIRTSTQVPFHVRRMLAPVLGLPLKRIRVIKPRVGGGFGGKQEVLIEDVAAHLTIATGRPVRFEYTRAEEFFASRSRHPMRFRLRTGVKRDGTITAHEMYCLSDTGAYGCHGLTVAGNTGHKAMALYVGDGKYRQSPNIRFHADVVYTNTPPAGAFRGYGVPQGFWPVERQMAKIAHALGLDPLAFRLQNALRAGEVHPFSAVWSEGREPRPEIINTCGLADCVRLGAAAIGWQDKHDNPGWHTLPGKPHLRRGIGVATVMQGTAIPYLDMGGASLKMNEDGSFNLLVGATDIGTGSDTVLAQQAAEVLGILVEDILVHSSDTDFTPFDKGAYASSTTYISGTAVIRAAQMAGEQIRRRAARLLSAAGVAEIGADEIRLADRQAWSPDGRSVSMTQIALNSLHHEDQEQIMGVGSYMSPVAPPPFAAQFAEVTVDIDTGQIQVDRLVIAVDAGVIINPLTASGQIEGGMTQALGYAVCEEMIYDAQGRPRETDLRDYHIFAADEMPALETIFVETIEPSHPFGVKAAGEIPLDGVAPAIGNAVFDACGASVDVIPITPERLWRALEP